ncbi:MAG: hypothetical protein OEV22_16705 [Deltaproteobacteria bacterium]|nr:hypothetical protein [Deltaproteobacteria bacterium]
MAGRPTSAPVTNTPQHSGSSQVRIGASVCRNDINPINVEVRNHL